jgi:hypothetical protein
MMKVSKPIQIHRNQDFRFPFICFGVILFAFIEQSRQSHCHIPGSLKRNIKTRTDNSELAQLYCLSENSLEAESAMEQLLN